MVVGVGSGWLGYRQDRVGLRDQPLPTLVTSPSCNHPHSTHMWASADPWVAHVPALCLIPKCRLELLGAWGGHREHPRVILGSNPASCLLIEAGPRGFGEQS